jgi:preprotein translocase subunit SecD
MKMQGAAFKNLLPGVLMALLAGCESHGGKFRQEVSTLRLHLEVTPDGTARNAPVLIYRAGPIYVNVEKDSFLNEGLIQRADVVNDLAGFSIRLQYEQKGSWLLENVTTANKGRRIAIFSQFGEARWLAAPVVVQRISNGTLQFTPDATREEAERIVRGLNNVAKEMIRLQH